MGLLFIVVCSHFGLRGTPAAQAFKLLLAHVQGNTVAGPKRLKYEAHRKSAPKSRKKNMQEAWVVAEDANDVDFYIHRCNEAKS